MLGPFSTIRDGPMRKKPLVELVTVDGVSSTGPLLKAASVLAGGDVLQLRLAQLPRSKPAIVAQAEAVLNQIVALLKHHHGLPFTAYVEMDEESYGTPVAPFRRSRFLLPHQDGGHSSFLTPSRLDSPELQPRERIFSSSVYWKRPSHKIFQGFVITSPGEPTGGTYYYRVLTMLEDAFIRAHGCEPSGISETRPRMADAATLRS
jgi:hypothetical protein